MKIDPSEVQGAWRLGWTLDVHTVSSEFLGYDGNGHPQFATTRSPLGEMLYLLKYRGQANAPQVAEVMADFFGNKPVAVSRIDVIVPMPASTTRQVQPVAEIAKALAARLRKKAVVNAVTKNRETAGLKDIHDPEERREVLDGAFDVDAAEVRGRGILLIDDLYRSGATANAVTMALMGAGASRIYFLAATRTRSKS